MADLDKNNTITGICNSALAMAGDNKFLGDISEENTSAMTCRMLLDQVVEEVQSHDYGVWDELYETEKLTLHGETFNGITRRYSWNLPQRMRCAVECYLEGSGVRVPFRIVGRLLECDKKENVWLKYVRYSMDPAEWSPELKSLVIRLLSIRLLSALSTEIRPSSEMEQTFWQFYYPLVTSAKKNKNTQNDFHGDDRALSRNYVVRGDGIRDYY